MELMNKGHGVKEREKMEWIKWKIMQNKGNNEKKMQTQNLLKLLHCCAIVGNT